MFHSATIFNDDDEQKPHMMLTFQLHVIVDEINRTKKNKYVQDDILRLQLKVIHAILLKPLTLQIKKLLGDKTVR